MGARGDSRWTPLFRVLFLYLHARFTQPRRKIGRCEWEKVSRGSIIVYNLSKLKRCDYARVLFVCC